jgi:hypothetical protein
VAFPAACFAFPFASAIAATSFELFPGNGWPHRSVPGWVAFREPWAERGISGSGETTLAQPSVLRRYRARRSRRIRRAFARHAREQAIPISGVTIPGRPPS